MNGTTEYADMLEHGEEIDAGELTLPQYLEQVNRPAKTEEGGFLVETEAQADWALRRYAQQELQAAEVDAMADRFIAEINAWRNARKARYSRGMDYFKGLLSAWFGTWRASHPKEKSCPLPCGVVGERAQQPEVQKDDAALVSWLMLNGHNRLVKVKESPDWAELKKDCDLSGDTAVYKPTGEEIPGIALIHRDSAFYVKPATLPEIVGETPALEEPEIE